MRLETDRLIIRPWTLDDVDAAFAIYGDAEVMRYVGTGVPIADREMMRQRLEKIIELNKGTVYGRWAVEKKDTGEVVGGGALMPLPDQTDIEVGYYLAKKWWGNGYATEAARALVTFALGDLGLTRLVGVTYPENTASMRVLEKAGLVHQGRATYLDFEVEFFLVER